MRDLDPHLRSPSERRWRRLALLFASLLALGGLAVAAIGVGLAVRSFADTTVADSAQAQWEQQTGIPAQAGGGSKEFGDCAVVNLNGSTTVVLVNRHGQWALAGRNHETATGYWDLDDVNNRDDCRAHAVATFVATAP